MCFETVVALVVAAGGATKTGDTDGANAVIDTGGAKTGDTGGAKTGDTDDANAAIDTGSAKTGDTGGTGGTASSWWGTRTGIAVSRGVYDCNVAMTSSSTASNASFR